jgi:hypothetical protein
LKEIFTTNPTGAAGFDPINRQAAVRLSVAGRTLIQINATAATHVECRAYAKIRPRRTTRESQSMSETRAKLGRRALVVDDELNDQSAAGHAVRRVVVALKSGQVDVRAYERWHPRSLTHK